MKKIFYVVLIGLSLVFSNLAFASKNNFQFQVKKYHTQRQSGQTLDLNIRYALRDDVESSRYPDYRELREKALQYLEPSDGLPTNIFWEIIAAEIGQKLMADYPLSGVSIQLIVYDNVEGTGSSYEPGDHGPIFTVGDVIPWNGF